MKKALFTIASIAALGTFSSCERHEWDETKVLHQHHGAHEEHGHDDGHGSGHDDHHGDDHSEHHDEGHEKAEKHEAKSAEHPAGKPEKKEGRDLGL